MSFCMSNVTDPHLKETRNAFSAHRVKGVPQQVMHLLKHVSTAIKGLHSRHLTLSCPPPGTTLEVDSMLLPHQQPKEETK